MHENGRAERLVCGLLEALHAHHGLPSMREKVPSNTSLVWARSSTRIKERRQFHQLEEGKAIGFKLPRPSLMF